MITARMAPTWMIAVNAVTPGSSTFQPQKSLRNGQIAGTSHREELGDAFEDAKRQGFDQIHGHPWDLEREQQPSQRECPECDQS
jgi:hypothetical protein